MFAVVRLGWCITGVQTEDFEDRQDKGDPHDADDNRLGRTCLRVRIGKVDRKFGLSVNSL